MADIVPANAEVAIARSAATVKDFIGSARVQEGIEAGTFSTMGVAFIPGPCVLRCLIPLPEFSKAYLTQTWPRNRSKLPI